MPVADGPTAVRAEWARIYLSPPVGVHPAGRPIFRPLDRLAANLFWPYLAWVGFATLLNASIWWLNR